jgi:23S rRNA pseudouridine1911/1915/1917 synthase
MFPERRLIVESEAAPEALAVGPGDARRRLDDFLAERFGTVSRMRLRQAVRDGEVTVNGATVPPGHRLSSGDRVTCAFRDLGPTAMTPEALPLLILYEDETLAVVEKPAGMPSHPTPHHRSGTLANALTHRFNQARDSDGAWLRPGLPHRLDRATSGLMVVTKTQEALRRLTMQFQERRIEKRYLALVHGRVAAEEGIVDAPIGSDPERRPRWGLLPGGRPAQTRYRVRERRGGFTLLELEPITGRTNQLRIHCAHHGHPILGDTEFGRDLAAGVYRESAEAQPPPDRLCLHAHALAFAHPFHGTPLRFESPLPEELSRWWAGLLDGPGGG